MYSRNTSPRFFNAVETAIVLGAVAAAVLDSGHGDNSSVQVAATTFMVLAQAVVVVIVSIKDVSSFML